MQQNFNNNFMRQMQQQFSLPSQNRNVNQQAQTALGTLQNGLNNLNTNVLMSALQQAAPTQVQNGQQGTFFDVQRAENILAAALAAANNNAQNQQGHNNNNTNNNTMVGGAAGGTGNPSHQQAQPQLQQNPFNFEGFDQLREFNPLQQVTTSTNQQNSTGFNDIRRQSLGGLGNLQQQLANVHQQQQQQQQNHLNQLQQQQSQSLSWMGQNINSSAFNPSLLASGVFGEPNNNSFPHDVFGTPAPNQGNLNNANLFNALNFQGPQQKRRSSSLSSGSLSPIGKQKVVNGASHEGISGMFPPNLMENDLGGGKGAKDGKKEKKKRAKTFPEKLMQSMMDFADEEAVAWLPDGKSFVIVNPDLFCREVLNKVFKESKYASFVRKLHRWGFVRLTSGTGTDCFHHPMFQRNRKELAAKITCTPRGDKDKPDRPASDRNVKPPSLAGVEKFIRAKVVAAAASAAANAEESLLLKGDDQDLSDDSGDASDDI